MEHAHTLTFSRSKGGHCWGIAECFGQSCIVEPTVHIVSLMGCGATLEQTKSVMSLSKALCTCVASLCEQEYKRDRLQQREKMSMRCAFRPLMVSSQQKHDDKGFYDKALMCSPVFLLGCACLLTLRRVQY